jgi:hypothetical protein
VAWSTLGTKRPKLGKVGNQSPRETESFRPSGWRDRRIGCAAKPCADKQRITGRTALPVPTTKVVPLVRCIRRPRTAGHGYTPPARAKCNLQPQLQNIGYLAGEG